MDSYICSVTSNNFMEYTKAFLYSYKLNAKLDKRIHFFHFSDDSYQTLSKDNYSILKKIYDNITFQEISFDYYDKKGKGQPHFLSLESFNQEAEKIVFMDSDLLITNDISEIFNFECKLGMVKEMNREAYNSGFMMINKELLNKNIYDRLLGHTKHPDTFGRDQAIINEVFAGQIHGMGHEYNCLVTEYKPYAKIYHYIVKFLNSDGKERIPKRLYDLYENYLIEANKIIK